MKRNTTTNLADMIERIIATTKPIYDRPYKGGRELRFHSLEVGKESVINAIAADNLPLEIFDQDIALKSISIRLKEGAA